jgi:hypothetical protein
VTSTTALSVVVVGSGRVGTALATNLRALGHDVRVARRSPHGDGEIGLDGAAVGADLTILAVPFRAVCDVVPRLGLEDGAVLVDATNPLDNQCLAARPPAPPPSRMPPGRGSTS